MRFESDEDLAAAIEANKREAVARYRHSGGDLFRMPHIIDANGGEVDVLSVDDLTQRIERYAGEFRQSRVRISPFYEDDLAQIIQAIQMPTVLTYATYRHRKGDKKTEYYPYQEELYTEDCQKIEALQKALLKYCREAAYLARRVRSGTSSDWNFAYKTIEMNCFDGAVGFPTCPQDDAKRIGGILYDRQIALQADLEMYNRELRDNHEHNHEDTAVKIGKRARRYTHNGVWFKVESDGMTITCPTKIGDTIRKTSYKMTTAKQMQFLKDLLLSFESGKWHKPAVPKSKWQNSLFKRGKAFQFLKDGHIVCWERDKHGYDNGGEKGAIRLEAPATRA